MASQKEKILKNMALAERYPFIIPRMKDGQIPKAYDYSYTLLDNLPKGWVESFGIEMLKEIRRVLVKENKLEDYWISELKQEAGSLKLKGNYNSFLLEETIDGYRAISECICSHCGRPAIHVLKNCLLPLCVNCKDKRIANGYRTEEDFLMLNRIYYIIKDDEV